MKKEFVSYELALKMKLNLNQNKMEGELDLFEHYHLLPENVQEILMKYGEMDQTYENCSALEKELDTLGYSMEYGLDAVPYNLQEKIIFMKKLNKIGVV